MLYSLTLTTFGEEVSAGGGLAGALRRKEPSFVVADLMSFAAGAVMPLHSRSSFFGFRQVPMAGVSIEAIRREAVHVAPRVAYWAVGTWQTGRALGRAEATRLHVLVLVNRLLRST